MCKECPIGTVIDYAGSIAPSGWLLCDGSAYASADYPELYAAIGTSFGGDGTVFNVPDCRGRASIGAGHGTGLTSRLLASKGGEETHQLTIAELASHSHVVFGNGLGVAAGGVSCDQLSATTGNGNVNSATTGSGTAHNTMQPFLVFNKIIKAIQEALVYSAWNKATLNPAIVPGPVESSVVWRSEPGDVIRWAGSLRLFLTPISAGTPLFIDENIPYPSWDFYTITHCAIPPGEYSSILMEFSAAGIVPVNEIGESGYTDLIFSGITYVVGVGTKLLAPIKKKT